MTKISKKKAPKKVSKKKVSKGKKSNDIPKAQKIKKHSNKQDNIVTQADCKKYQILGKKIIDHLEINNLTEAQQNKLNRVWRFKKKNIVTKQYEILPSDKQGFIGVVGRAGVAILRSLRSKAPKKGVFVKHQTPFTVFYKSMYDKWKKNTLTGYDKPDMISAVRNGKQVKVISGESRKNFARAVGKAWNALPHDTKTQKSIESKLHNVIAPQVLMSAFKSFKNEKYPAENVSEAKEKWNRLTHSAKKKYIIGSVQQPKSSPQKNPNTTKSARINKTKDSEEIKMLDIDQEAVTQRKSKRINEASQNPNKSKKPRIQKNKDDEEIKILDLGDEAVKQRKSKGINKALQTPNKASTINMEEVIQKPKTKSNILKKKSNVPKTKPKKKPNVNTRFVDMEEI
jgi:hypothetical protein